MNPYVKERLKASAMGVLFVGLGFVFGILAAPQYTADMAVEAGHAEYYLDADHERQWRWLPPCDGKRKPEVQIMPEPLNCDMPTTGTIISAKWQW